MSLTNRIALFGVVAFTTVMVGCGNSKSTEDPEAIAHYEQRKRERIDRFNAGPYVASDKEIAPGERIRLVVVPGKRGPYSDTNCVLYTNLANSVSSMACPDHLVRETDK